MKQLEVQIMGQSYLLGCPEGGEARLLEAVERVDTAMCRIRDAGKVRARERIAVLAALNLAFDNADQQASSAAAAPAPASAGLANGTATHAVSEDEAALLRALMSKLDAALGDDGRLL